MKSKLLTAIAVLLSVYGSAQTKGTSALSLGIGINTNKTSDHAVPDANTTKIRNSTYNLGYGLFVNDNSKVGVDLLYGDSKSDYSSSDGNTIVKTYGAAVSYQKYYPLIGKFFAYAGGAANYAHSKTKYTVETNPYTRNSTGNQYGVEAFGGITWFISKRWAFETRLLSADAYYAKQTTDEDNNSTTYGSEQTEFKLTSEGFINDLGFKIYLLF